MRHRPEIDFQKPDQPPLVSPDGDDRAGIAIVSETLAEDAAIRQLAA